MTDPFVVIVVPCISFNDYVFECLCGCTRLDYTNYQIVLLPDYPLTLPDEFCSNVLIHPTGALNIAAKRNIALCRYPDAAFYALVDSDAYPRQDWLRNAITAFEATGAWAVGGPNVSPPDEPFLNRAVGNASRSVLVSGNMAFAKTLSISRYCRNLHSCNLVLSRRIVDEVGLFNEKLRTGEDRDLCHRIQRNGGKIYFDKDVVVYHHNRQLGMHYWGQRFVHGYSIYSIAKSDRSLGNLPLFVPPLAGAILVAAAALGFVNSLFWLLCGGILGTCGLLVMVEAVRYSGRLREVPVTFVAIIASGIGYVVGSLFGILGIGINFRKLYHNYPGRDDTLMS
ncbi:MAG: hypothetical protein HZB62_12610 [Nitrospirae bacterium]|nr:hypothetical protein [Nitrospirota bacterium]